MEDVMVVMGKWTFAQNTWRKNVFMEGQEYGYSDTFGVSVPRIRNGTHAVQISKATKDYPEMTELIVKWAMQEYEILKTFPFTTFTING